MAPKVCLITARFGLQDPVPPPLDGVAKAICISDYPANVAPGWEFRLAIGDRREARRVKLNPWDFDNGGYDWFLWIDSNMTPYARLAAILAPTSTGESLYVSPHPQRSCVYRELLACLKLKKETPLAMTTMVDRYRKEGMPANLGLVETGLLLLKNDQRARNFCRLWYNEIKYGSARDQLSFPYVVWKYGLTYGLFPQPARTLYVKVSRHAPLQRPV